MKIKQDKSSGRMHISGLPLERAKSYCDLANGGEIICDVTTMGNLGAAHHVIITHQGAYKDKDPDGTIVDMLQITVPGLYERQLHWTPRTLSYFDSPDHNDITIAFCHVGNFSALSSWNTRITEQAVEQFNYLSRKLLYKHSGYESREHNGSFLLSFKSPLHFLAWACDFQVSVVSQ